MSQESSVVDALVIGSGPGGYVCGIRLGQLGMKTIVVEREQPGGVCLNVGCIPSKALIHAAKTYEKLGKAGDMGITIASPPTMDVKKMQAWKAGIVSKLTSGVKALLKANKAEFVVGAARLAGPGKQGHKVVVKAPDGKETTYEAKNVVLATGSRPIVIPGFELAGQQVIDSTGALALDHVPKRMVVIGGGYIGLELGTVYAKLGTKVTVVEALDSLLAGMDKDCVKVVAQKLGKMGVEILLGAKAKGWKPAGSGKDARAVVTVDHKGQDVAIDTDVVLVSVGRRPNSGDLGLDVAGVKLDGKGFVAIDGQCKTNVAGIYAIGDLVGGMMLAHKASKEAVVVAEIIAGHKAAMDVRTIPAVVFTDPEIASTGMTEEQARAAGHELRIGKFPFAALGRAMSVNDTDGFAKVIADKATGELLGMHLVANGASDLISEGAFAIEMGAVVEDLMLTIHPHPTLSEALMEAAAAAMGEAIHIANR